VTIAKIILACAAAIAINSGAWAQTDETTGKILKIDQANGKITLQHKQGGTVGSSDKLLTDEYQIGRGLALSGLKPGDQVIYTESRVDNVWTVTKIQKQ
jgi:Cu/Ag efflux protein CusF